MQVCASCGTRDPDDPYTVLSRGYKAKSTPMYLSPASALYCHLRLYFIAGGTGPAEPRKAVFRPFLFFKRLRARASRARPRLICWRFGAGQNYDGATCGFYSSDLTSMGRNGPWLLVHLALGANLAKSRESPPPCWRATYIYVYILYNKLYIYNNNNICIYVY